MNEMSKLIVATDLSDNAKVGARWASRFGQSDACEVVVVHVTEINLANWASGAYDMLDDEELHQKAERRVRAWYVDATGEEPDDVDVRIGTSRIQLTEAVEQHQADCLILARSGKTSWEKFWLGSTAKALANEPPCNVVIVHPEHTEPNVEDIAVGTDFTPTAEGAVRGAAELAHRLHARLHLVHSETEPVVDCLEADEVPEEYRRGDLYLAARQSMDELVERQADALEGLDYETHIIKEEPARGLIDFIGANEIDLVVVGRSGQSPFVASVLGSVLNKVVQGVPATLMITPTAEDEA